VHLASKIRLTKFRRAVDRLVLETLTLDRLKPVLL
jgi:hypothetical protein